MKHWEDFLKELEGQLGKPAVDRWLRPFKVIDFDAANLYLKAEDAFQALWFEKELRKIAKERFLNEAGRPIKVHIQAHDLPEKQPKPHQQQVAPTYTTNPLDPSCRFESFIASKQNHPFLEFLKTLKPGTSNPLFIYGRPGVGKTHLLMSLAARFQTEGLKILYTHAQTFTEHVVSAIRSGNVEPLRQTYRHVDALFVDDIHCLAKKGATQEEFFHTFNSLHGRGCQIVLTSQMPPSRLEEIEPRLISRFEWGLVFEVYPPTPELFHQILSKRAQLLNLQLSDETLEMLLAIFKTGLKSALQSLDALALRVPNQRVPLTDEQIQILLKDLIEKEQKSEITPQRILHTVSHYFGLRPEDLLGKSQSKEVVLPRQIAIFLIRNELKTPFLTIGKLFCRDHSTIMASARLIETKKGTEAEVARALFEIREKIFNS